MKKLLIIGALALASQINYGQNAFDKFENKKDITSVVITSDMFKLMDKADLGFDDKYLGLIEDLNNVRIYMTDKAEIAQEMKLVVDTYLKASPKLTELMRVNDDGKNIRFYSKQGKNEKINELLMFMDDSETQDKQTVIVSITGSSAF